MSIHSLAGRSPPLRKWMALPFIHRSWSAGLKDFSGIYRRINKGMITRLPNPAAAPN